MPFTWFNIIMDIFVTEPFTIKQSPTCFLPNLEKKQDEAYWIFPPFCPTRKTPQFRRELTQCEGSKAIFMSLCGGRAPAWGNLESVLPFKLWARPPSSAAQLSCYLIFTKSCWKHSLPFLKEWEETSSSAWRWALELRSWRSVGTDGAVFSDVELLLPKCCRAAHPQNPAVPGPSTWIGDVSAWGCRTWGSVMRPWITKMGSVKDSKTRNVSEKSICPQLG